MLRESFDRMAALLGRFDDGKGREVLSLGAVGTFALGWLLPRLAQFEAAHPFVDLRLTTNNNRVDIAEEGLDFAIRFGDGAWHGTDALAAVRRAADAALRAGDRGAAARARRSRRRDPAALLPRRRMAGLARSGRRAAAAADRAGVRFGGAHGRTRRSPATASRSRRRRMFERELAERAAARPFRLEVGLGGYWLTSLKSRRPTPAMAAFHSWILAAAVD